MTAGPVQSVVFSPVPLPGSTPLPDPGTAVFPALHTPYYDF
jgi:hypothetical protein